LWLSRPSVYLSEHQETKRHRYFHARSAADCDSFENPLHAFSCVPCGAETPAVQYEANRQPLGEALLF